jgi:enamine deaminase RidA (YjgF/YER057c/UK114 family)
MIKALSLAAALALLPLSAAVAQEAKGSSEAALEAAAAAFEARMEAFGERAEAISEDSSLSEDQRELRIAALWSEYQPDVNAFTAAATQHASGIAAEALAGIDIEAVVAEALADVDVSAITAEALAGVDIDAITAEALAEVEASGVLQGALAGAQGMAVNGSWASNDPEHMATYGLVADYALGEALDPIADADTADAAAEEPAPADD